MPEPNRLLMRAVVLDLFDNQAASSKDHEGYWYQHADQRGWPIFTLRPDGHNGRGVPGAREGDE